MRALLLLAIGAGLLLSLHVFAPPATGLWLRTLLNSLHVVVFAVVALALFTAVDVFTSRTRAQSVMIAGIIAIVLGLASEAAQVQGPRDASVQDLWSNASGTIGALLIVLAAGDATSASGRARFAFLVTGIAILLAALSSLVSVSAAYIERNARTPVLVSFDSYFARTFIRTQNATLALTIRQPAMQMVGQVLLHKGAWPALIFPDIWPNWQPYSTLAIDLVLPGEVPLDINIRVHDRRHLQGDQPYSDRFNMTYAMQPGQQTLRIPLERIRNAPTKRHMDLAQIGGMALFFSSKEAGRKFELLEIRLE